MKTVFNLFPVFFLMVTNVNAQDIMWEKSYGGKHAEYLMDIQSTADYGFILAGSSLSKRTGNKTDDNKGDLDYWIWKMDEKGELNWQKSFGGPGADFLHSIKNTLDGGFILAGISNSSNETHKGIANDKKEACRGGDDFWIIKLDATGGEEWQKTIGGKGQEKLKSICQTADGGYIIGGSSSSNISFEKTQNSFGSMDYWVVKLDKKGEIEWQKTFGGIYFDELRSIEQTKDFGYIIGGYSNSPESGNKEDKNLGDGDFWILKLDKTGEIQWQKTIGGNLDDQLSVVHQTYDEGYLLGGSTNSDATKSKSHRDENGSDFWIVKIDKEGDILWDEKYNVGDTDILSSLVENKDHTILLGGYAQSEAANYTRKDVQGINDFIAIKISDNGEELWRKSVGSAGEDVLKKIIETRDGAYVMAGTSNPTKSNSKPNISRVSSKGLPSGNLGNNLKESNSPIANSIEENSKKANDFYNDTIGDAKNELYNAVGLDKDSPIKTEINLPNNPLGSASSNGGDGKSPAKNQNQKSPSSRDKNTNYGSSDFWVVKLKDNIKPEEVKVTIEAFPNPTANFTNIIIGYDYVGGTATVVDMAGRVLQQFEIKDRTIPISLQGLPVGIYVVNIKTERQSDGVKIIKSMYAN